MPLLLPGHCGLLLRLLLLLILLAPPPRCAAESATCLAVYREGGAPAVFQSAHCPRWTLPPPGAGEGADDGGDRSSPMGCHVAADRGRRRSQEDRAVCALGIRIPFLGTCTSCSTEASQKHFESGSTATVVLIADGKIISANVGDSKAFLCSEGHDPHRRNTFVLAIWINTNKKACIASGKRRRKRNSIDHEEFALANYDGPLYRATELSKDHHPDREDERSRVEASGGYVIEWAGVYRVNGKLALSRAIGDLSFKRYGVIPTPELTGWKFLSENDTFLVASSDGIFEKMTMQDVCDLMLHAKLHVNQDLGSSAITQHNLADYVVRVALQKGTTDNVAAVVVPLGSPSSPGMTLEDWSQFEENLKTSISPSLNIPYQLKSGTDETSSAVIEMEYFRRSSAKFQRFLVEAKLKRLGCFYLSESLDEDMDYIFRVPEAYQREETHEFSHIPRETAIYSDGNVEKYKDRHFCLYLVHQDGEMGQCNGPEAVANFFGLLDSLPHNGSKPNGYHSFGNKIDFRSTTLLREHFNYCRTNFSSDVTLAAYPNEGTWYKLKKRFDRGSYGEVWLAFHWNCSEDIDVHKEPQHFTATPKSDSYNCTNSNTMPSNEDHVSDTVDGDLFILKRIMLMGLKACHDRNITHRDIKPENMIICFEDVETGKCLRDVPSEAKQNKLNMRLIDFGSAIDDHTLKHLYGSGPTRSEQTFEYTPPEALLNSNWFQGSKSARLKYDIWSVGVVMLELIMGSPHVFQISDRTRVLMDQRLEGWSEQTKELAYK
nr:unnamed protein product [Digitaria exilis]